MSTILNMTRDVAGYNGFGLQPSKDIYGGTMAATTVYTVTVPSNYQNWLAVFSYTGGADIWVAYNTTATVPSTGAGAITTELNPAGRQLKAGDTISLITADASTPAFSIIFYVIATYTN